MILQFDFGLAQTGVGYQFYDEAGHLLGSRITAGISHGHPDGLYLADDTPPSDAVGVYWNCDNPEFDGFDAFDQQQLSEVQQLPSIFVDTTGASPQFFPDPVGPFIYCEPDVAGSSDIITVAVQGGIFSGLNFSGTTAGVQRFERADINFVRPTTVRNLIVDRFGNSTFRIGAGDLAQNEATVGVRYSKNLTFIGTQEVEIDNFGRLALVLDKLLLAFKHIQRFEELGRVSEDGSKAIFGWGNWHITPEPVFMRNDNTWVERNNTTNYSIDYKRGAVFFNHRLARGEDLRATYEIRLLDLATYKGYFETALGMINAKKPQTSYTASDYPGVIDGLLILYGYIVACRSLIPMMSTFKYRRLFENPDQLVASLQANIQMATQEFDNWIGTLKRRGLIMPAAISSFNVGRQGVVMWDGINVMEQLVIGRV